MRVAQYAVSGSAVPQFTVYQLYHPAPPLRLLATIVFARALLSRHHGELLSQTYNQVESGRLSMTLSFGFELLTGSTIHSGSAKPSTRSWTSSRHLLYYLDFEAARHLRARTQHSACPARQPISTDQSHDSNGCEQ